MLKISLLLCLSLFSLSFASAGDLLTYKKDAGIEGFRLLLDKSHMRIDVLKGSDQSDQSDQSVLYSQEKHEATILNHKKKEAITIDEKTIAKFAELSKRASEMMKSLPPEMQKMMKEKMGMAMKANAGKKSIEIKKMASGVMVGKWKTTQYEISKDGKKESEVW